MAGLIERDRGEVTWRDEPVHTLGEGMRARHFAYVPQQGSVAFGFTVRQVVAMGARATGAAKSAVALRDTVDAALVACDLETVADRSFNALSGGQQQRVTLARAVAQTGLLDASDAPQGASKDATGAGRPIWLLDEPFSAMDPRHVAASVRLLRLAAAQGHAVVLVLHDLSLVARMAEVVWLLNEGCLAASGAMAEVMTSERLSQVYGLPIRCQEGPGGNTVEVDPAAYT